MRFVRSVRMYASLAFVAVLVTTSNVNSVSAGGQPETWRDIYVAGKAKVIHPSVTAITSVTSKHERVPLGRQAELMEFTSSELPLAAQGVEQVHIQMGHDSSTVIVTWNAPDSESRSCGVYIWVTDGGTPSFVPCSKQLYSINGTDAGSQNHDTSLDVKYIVVSGLQERTRYQYRIHGSNFESTFRTTPSAGSNSIVLGVVGDVGQTANSNQTMQHVYELKDELDMILHAGDISYADGFQPRWDSYGRLSQYLFSTVPTIYTAGNHEMVEPQCRDYLVRYPQDHEASGSTSPFWYSAEHGPAHVTVLNPYVAFEEGSEQMAWLRRDFASVDRSMTPWLIVLSHVPWYNSNTYHMGEGDPHRTSLEELFMEAGVNIVFTGHVHSYERWHPTFKGETTACGITYLNIGDGGNREGLAGNWQEVQPPNSALREDSYGSGVLRIDSETEARWEWHRNQDGTHTIADTVILTRDPSCWNSKTRGSTSVV